MTLKGDFISMARGNWFLWKAGELLCEPAYHLLPPTGNHVLLLNYL